MKNCDFFLFFLLKTLIVVPSGSKFATLRDITLQPINSPSPDVREPTSSNLSLVGKTVFGFFDHVRLNPVRLATEIDEPRYEKTGFLHMRKQRRRPASR